MSRNIMMIVFTLILINCISIFAIENGSNGLNEINLNIGNSTTLIEKVTSPNNWVEFKKNTTNKAFRAFGTPINVSGYNQVNENNIKAISLKFISENEKMLGVDKNQVVYFNSNNVNGKWYVHLHQVVNGLTVALSDIELKVNDKAQIFSYGVEYFETFKNDLDPKIDFNNIQSKEASIHSDTKLVFNETKSGKLYAFPIYENGKYHLEAAYLAEYNYDNDNYSVYISSINGKTLFRKNMTHNLKTKIKVFTNIKEDNSLSPVVKVPVAFQGITIGGKSYVTDEFGNLDIDLDKPQSINVEFEGPWAIFQNEVFPQGEIHTTLQPGEENHIEWDNLNSDMRERMVVHHLNKIRDYFKSFDTTKKAMDFQMTLKFENRGADANAYSSGEVISFVGLNDKSANLPETPTVLYHEYGHSINILLYQELGKPSGMVNRAAHEGIADITAALMVDDPRVGYGAFTDPNKIVRNCKNIFKYPKDMNGESHNDGQILSGALWDLRELTDLKTARNLCHFARYGLPDDEDNGICFSEWLIEVLVADDDDGDLTNGTPNSKSIIKAFDNHNIGFEILLQKSLVHNQKTQFVTGEKLITVIGNYINMTNFNKDSFELSLVYSYDNFKTQKEINFNSIEANTNNFKFEFEKLGNFGIVNYYFNLKNITTGKLNEKISNKEGKSLFSYEYGFVEKFRENFLSQEWVLNRAGSQGASLEIAKPDEFDYMNIGLNVKQTSDSDDPDDICLVTGAKSNPNSFWMDVPHTNLEGISPNINLSGYYYPVLKFSVWYSKQSLDNVSDVDLSIDVSSDYGLNWKQAYKLDDKSVQQNDWVEQTILLKNYIDINDKFKFRVRIDPNNYFSAQGGFPSCFSEFQIDNISIIDPKTFSSVETAINDELNIIINKENIIIKNTKPNQLISSISLFDMNGRLVKFLSENNIQSNINELSLSRVNINIGIYFLRINTDNQIITKKILIYD